ncbi:ATP-binding response regulator [Comamonas kerstersii]|uniref:ATP-binding response regulator n=1 Tax=Comamonas kerstersii TaxID=225992 RepID=UPI0009863B76|nr:ATP-binding protein [Comamonas kerstersii]OOH84692.1 hypothetical protein BMF38_15410 [Comamonas kerstersii]OOH90720.1 hypothetical protein BMF29_12205 [Comamonas kerstersii]
MGNAVKFTERGHVQLRVNDEQCRLHLTIQDTGIGIAQDKLERIFDPFAQADASTTRRFGGTGLGTTISRQLVQLMGGAISVSSREGEGTQFHVQLPLPIGQAPIDEAVASAVQLPPLHILAADDVPQNLELLQVVMQRHGHQVVSASDGLQALQLRQEMARVLQGRTASESGKHQPAAGASAVPAVLAHAAAESEVVDWHTGLQLWGSEAALRTAWSRFLNEQHSRVPELQSLSQHGDWDTALAVVHRMRGAAGNLALLRSAEVTSAAPALAPAAMAAEAGLSAAARTQVQEALQALTEALQGGEIDSEALQQLQQLLPEAMVAALQAAIDMFGFDQALQCAQALASSVSTSSDSERKPPHAAQA